MLLPEAKPIPESVSSWIEAMKRTRNVETDRVDLSRVTQLYCTLPNRDPSNDSRSLPQEGDPLGLGHHLVLFPPLIPEKQLNADGTDPTYNSPPPFTRRMWAGGSFEFDPNHVIRVGEDVTCETTVSGVDVKASRTDTMIFVNQRRQIRNINGHTAITERRTHVFLRPPDGGMHSARSNALSLPDELKSQSPHYVFSFTATPVTLFRFSALTFNSHMVHLDSEFSRKVDGHPERLVHGPLTALMLLDVASANLPDHRNIAIFSYRARRPIIVNQPLTLKGTWTSSGGRAWAQNEIGEVCMTAEITLQ